MTQLMAGDRPSVAVTDTAFDRTTALVPDGADPAVLHAELDDGWSSLTGIHGGYMVALAVRAAEAAAQDRQVRTITTSFLRPGRPGPGRLTVGEVRRGRNLTVLTVGLEQDAKPVTTSRITLATNLEGTSWTTPALFSLVPRDQCVPVVPPEGIGHFDQATAVLDPNHLPFTHGSAARIGGYIRPRDPRPIDAAWLAMALDWFPPSPFSHTDPPTGGVSIDLAVHIHATRNELPRDEWLAGTFQADTSAGGLALERGRLADAGGVVLAESFHTRWTG